MAHYEERLSVLEARFEQHSEKVSKTSKIVSRNTSEQGKTLNDDLSSSLALNSPNMRSDNDFSINRMNL